MFVDKKDSDFMSRIEILNVDCVTSEAVFF